MTISWPDVVAEALRTWTTPFYLTAWGPVLAALDDLEPLLTIGVPVRHWLSVKTHPVRPLLSKWRSLGFGAEVVSCYELLAALRIGFEPASIVVNGTAKHSWLPDVAVPGLRVHLDSLAEMQEIGFKRLGEWRLGIRCHVQGEFDPDDPQFKGQFGMNVAELTRAVRLLADHALPLEGLHFHLRSDVRDPIHYRTALREILALSATLDLASIYVDCGGGFPAPGENALGTGAGGDSFDLGLLAHLLRDELAQAARIRELWFENGKFVTGRSAVLVVTVLDVKERPEGRYLICNGGRTNHAFVSDWQEHPVLTLPQRRGTEVLTTVSGPTCMAYDRLTRRPLPASISPGDHLLWLNAGAYHLPWETRFSHGLASVIWCDERRRLSLARPAETFESWWGMWV